MKKKLFIFTNESISLQDENYYCDNIDLKSSPEGLNKKFEVNLFGRRSLKNRAHVIKLKKIKIFSNIFSAILPAQKPFSGIQFSYFDYLYLENIIYDPIVYADTYRYIGFHLFSKLLLFSNNFAFRGILKSTHPGAGFI